MITEDYISFEIVKLLKEKGFDVDEYEVHYDPLDHTQYEITLQMAMKWLREVHNIFIQVCVIPHYTVAVEQEYYFIKLYINRRWKSFQELDEMRFSSPELAYEAAIKYCLENLI